MTALSILIKPASSSCNLRCKYCFYHSLSKNRSVDSYGIMSENTLENIVKKSLLESEPECTFVFQGGEPTLVGLDFYKTLIELEKKHNIKNIKINNLIQTNSIVINDEWAVFLHDNNFLVGLSLDGPKDINDLNRIDVDGKGTYTRIMKSIAIMDKHKVEYNVLSVVTSSVARYGKRVYDFYKKNGFRYFQFIQCLDPLNKDFGSNKYSLTPEIYGQFLNDIFDKWYEDVLKDEFVEIRYFNNLISMIAGNRPEACGMSGICSCEFVMESDGGVYPCDFYVIDEWRMGNINDMNIRDLFYSEAAQNFIKKSANLNDKCRECKWLNICRGGCKRHREPIVNEIPSINYFCKSYEMFFEKSYARLLMLSKKCYLNINYKL